jgi:eukaryotic-like serine/threonine-protein kinase
MATSTHVDRNTFLENVRRSGLLTSNQLDELNNTLPDTERGRVVARALVERGLLTRFQAEQLLAGRTSGFLLGQYRILDQIGQGGMGRVFKADHRTLGRLVALKVLAPGLLKTERVQQLFRREVRAAARLLHPNIVTAFDAGQEGARAYLVMEFVEGPNLDQLVRARGPLPVGLACDYVRQIAQGLQYAHLRGMVHRDIKPANILVQPDEHLTDGPGTAKLTDFGLARLQESSGKSDAELGTVLTKPNTVMGTPDYIAPEQARSLHKADIRSDLYSLGCTFYYLLTGQVPFPGGHSLEKLVRHASEEIPSVELMRPGVPEPVAVIIRRLMDKDPEKRFQTPAELALALEPFCLDTRLAWNPESPTVPLVDGALSTPYLSDGSQNDVSLSDDGSILAGSLPAEGGRALPTTRIPLSSGVVESRRWRRFVLAAALLALAGSVLGAGLAVLLNQLLRHG